MVEYVIARLKEPSTYAAITGLLVAVGVNISEGMMGSIAAVGAAVAGLVGVILSEKASA